MFFQDRFRRRRLIKAENKTGWRQGRNECMSTLYKNETYEFILKEIKGDGQSGAEIIRRCIEDGEEIVLFSYY